MNCDSTSSTTREILQAARAGGYRFAFFDRAPGAGDLLLRHDVDLSLDAAAGDWPSWRPRQGASCDLLPDDAERVLQPRLAVGHGGDRAAARARPPRRASTPSGRDVDRDERFDPVVAWHNPDPEYMSEPVEGVVNVMQAPWFDPGRYRSDSNQHWRHGCPHEELARGEFEWLQLLTHPEIWVYPGETMRETMLAMLDAERDRRLDAARRRPNRPRVKRS